MKIERTTKIQNCQLMERSMICLSLLIILVLPAFCLGQTAVTESLFYPIESQRAPSSDCYKNQKPKHSMGYSQEKQAYELVVDLPKTMNRKNLIVDIDYNSGKIEVYGYWMEHKVRGDKPKKTCLYQEFQIESDSLLVHPESSIYDLVMEIQDQKLILSLPMAMKETVASSSITLWEKMMGLARLSKNSVLTSATTTNFTTTTTFSPTWDNEQSSPTMTPLPSTAITNQHNVVDVTYLKSRQDALERFLQFSLGMTDEETHWLKQM